MEEQSSEQAREGERVEIWGGSPLNDPLAWLQGYSEHSVDDKGRIIMPQRFRDLFDRSCVLTQGWGKCLFVFHPTTWQRVQINMARLPLIKEEAVVLQRYIIGTACFVDIDSQGRLAIPAHLREHAQISLPTAETQSIVVIIGAPYRLEIWSKQQWKEMNARLEDAVLFQAAERLNLSLDLVR
ncbi:MAG: division/cell wall cluster transcriptional repressor MraZ [Armatimonadota bacterium]|nr:division/cell wall cluster transcriptional repressor MraZ [bacterium]MCS7308863.1 division/cell wall cluster transcriptional repressor MraZ [Armatimonadota bacterium]MDW8103393.1 division/cell wall cluster transcriptional repressor MraZ [Armatimonadota bacterium]MDW8289755.1 division/cell wall cluster transcriptional repressor MraZ [Armatimonadota bacterium]